jgi:hypothetical protein
MSRALTTLFRGLPLLLSGLLLASEAPAAAPSVAFHPEPGQLRIEVDGKPCARYVYRDARIPRPYFCDLREPGGFQVTRNHPPVEGQDPTDHDAFHPGLWLAFGDLNGADFWRNKARVEHVKLVREPRSQSKPERGGFIVENRYVTEAGAPCATETCRVTVLPREAGTLLLLDSEFVPLGGELAFGDQEEMGLGVRVATPLTVTKGGRIRNRDGGENEKAVRGTNAAWCDYSGSVNGRRVGICLMPDPANFRPSWYHARDYGLLVANPFGRQALTGGEKSRVVVKPGERLRLRFGVLLHGSPGPGADLPAAYEEFLRVLRSASER